MKKTDEEAMAKKNPRKVLHFRDATNTQIEKQKIPVVIATLSQK